MTKKEFKMKKRLTTEDITATDGPMNAVAKDDAMYYLGYGAKEELTVDEGRALRAKKNKIVTSSKKMERKVSREATRLANRLE
jgi:hypothetical protein